MVGVFYVIGYMNEYSILLLLFAPNWWTTILCQHDYNINECPQQKKIVMFSKFWPLKGWRDLGEFAKKEKFW